MKVKNGQSTEYMEENKKDQRRNKGQPAENELIEVEEVVVEGKAYKKRKWKIVQISCCFACKNVFSHTFWEL